MDGKNQEVDRATYTVKETARLMRAGINQVYEAIHEGQIPSIKVGNRYHVPAWFIRRLMKGPDE